MNISNFLNGKNNPSHNELDFINTNTKCDTTLFIDPVLIELGNTDFCEKAKKVTKDYFDKLFDVYYDDIKDNQKRYAFTSSRQKRNAESSLHCNRSSNSSCWKEEKYKRS